MWKLECNKHFLISTTHFLTVFCPHGLYNILFTLIFHMSVLNFMRSQPRGSEGKVVFCPSKKNATFTLESKKRPRSEANKLFRRQIRVAQHKVSHRNIGWCNIRDWHIFCKLKLKQKIHGTKCAKVQIYI